MATAPPAPLRWQMEQFTCSHERARSASGLDGSYGLTIGSDCFGALFTRRTPSDSRRFSSDVLFTPSLSPSEWAGVPERAAREPVNCIPFKVSVSPAQALWQRGHSAPRRKR